MRSALGVTKLLERHIESCLGFDLIVSVRTPGDLGRSIGQDPFSAEARKDPAEVQVTFLAFGPSDAMFKSNESADKPRDEFCAERLEIFLHWSTGCGRAKLNGTFFERKLKTPLTTRHWRTVEDSGRLRDKG